MATEKKVDWNKENPDIEYVGSKITLPGDPGKMPLDDAIEALKRKKADEETILQAVETVDAHPMDGAVAFMKAMQRKYGWSSPVPTPGMFGPTPPTLLTVKTGPHKEDATQVIWGAFKLPGVENALETGAHMKEGQPVFIIHGKVRRREMVVVKELAEITRDILKTESIYKGKAIRLKVDGDGNIQVKNPPDFLPTDYISPGELILNAGEAEQIDTALWVPIKHTAECVAARIPLKRGILLEGPYGCGKTMSGNVTSKICIENGWTFILLDDVGALKDALLFAQRYAPAVVFSEDIDRVIEQRDQRGNDLLNTIDGILAKDSKVITVLTTNFVEKLDRAMLRPGRLDSVISLRAPDAVSVQRLVHIYARKLLADGEDLSEVGEVLAGNIPATVREVVERSKLAMIGRKADHIQASHLLVAARGMQAHLDLLKEKPHSLSAAEALGIALREVVLDGRGKKIDEIHQHTV